MVVRLRLLPASQFPMVRLAIWGLSLPAAVLVASETGLGQTATAPAFEVISVKPNNSGDERSSSIVMPGARYQATNVTLRMLIKTAYGVHDDQVVGGPGWIDVERFDVAGKGTGNPTTSEFRDQARLMLRSVLANRFRLSFAREQRDIPVYALMVAANDGRTGPQLRRTDESACDGPPQSVPVAASAPEQNPPSPCNSGFSRTGHVGARGLDISILTTQVFQWADRIVVDRAGLRGRFDWDLQWTQGPLTVDVGPTNVVTLVTALREQLGLKLEPQRAPVEVFVIQQVERPTPD